MGSKRRSGGSYDQYTPHKRPRVEAGNGHNGNINQTSVPPAPQIKDAALEKAVFTHPFFGSQERETFVTYDRLEFYGDAEIERMATRLVWETYKALPVGKMSQIREQLVKNETLSKFSAMYGFDERLKATHPSNLFKQGKETQKIYGDVFEAYVAAIVLSDPHGYMVAEEWLHELWASTLQDPSVTVFSAPVKRNKQDLASKILGKGAKVEYKDEKPATVHKGKGIETYFIGIYFTGYGWENKHLGSGTGVSKNAAGDRAAAEALENPVIQEISAARTEEKRKAMEQKEALVTSQGPESAHD